MTIVGRMASLGLRALVRGYQLLIRPVMPPSCRYFPSCSHYALDALSLHGPLSGSWLAARRIVRCHPWGGQGVDPVPEPGARQTGGAGPGRA